MQFVDFLKRFDGADSPVSPAGPHGDAFDPVPAPVPGYVPPTISVAEWPPEAGVVLVEAAGAVGKSAAAHAIANALQWPLVRSEKAQVGSYSLSGLIHDTLGFTSPFLGDVARGSAGIVVDSLDEAHFRAGTDNFLAFLDNVGKLAGEGTAPRSPSIILLSRSDTAELVRLAFADANLPLAHVHLDFFDRAGAVAFIRAYLAQRFEETKRPEYNAPLASPAPFERLRDSRMRQIARVLLQDENANYRDRWDEVKDFLGYTPVLVALAESLATRNPSAAQAALTAGDQSNLLREIVDHISQREQRKFSEHLQPKLQALLPVAADRDVVASAMYAPSEQCARLFAFSEGQDLASKLPGTLPDEVRAAYEEAVRTFLPDHPFIKSRQFASVVFGDFVRATACRSIEVRAALASAPEQAISSVGPFFTRFLADGGNSEPIEVAEALIEQIADSWGQEAELTRAADSEITISIFEDGGTIQCWRDGSGEEPIELEFCISSVSGALHLRRPLKRANVVTDQGVILGERAQHFLAGPNATIVASELVIEAETLRVENDHGRAMGVALAADVVQANYLTKVECGRQDLVVFTEQPPARLRPYQRQMAQGGVLIPFKRYLDLRTLLTAFRPSAFGAPAVLAAKVDKKLVKDDSHRARIFEHLVAVGAVSRSGPLYHLDLSALGDQGFGLQDVKSGEPSEAVLRFLRDCVGKPEA